MEKVLESPKILLLNFELEWAAEKDGEIRLDDPQKFKELVDAEFSIIQSKLNAIRDSGAKLVFSNKSVGDLATQFFADNGIFGTGRVLEDDLRRMSVQCGSPIISAISDIMPANLGTCGRFEER